MAFPVGVGVAVRGRGGESSFGDLADMGLEIVVATGNHWYTFWRGNTFGPVGQNQ